MLNHAPTWIKYGALEGMIIVDMNPVLRVSLKLAAIDNVLLEAQRLDEH